MDNILKRKSVRKYTNQKVEEEKIQQLLKAAMAAPTAGNQREWEFIVINDKKILRSLADISRYAGCIKDAPLAIIPMANRDKMNVPDNWEQDLGACCENILLAAVACGLGAVWLGVAPLADRMSKLSMLLNLPDNIIPFAMIAIGYAADKEEDVIRDRFEEERVHYNKY